jgi:hypothetical protein
VARGDVHTIREYQIKNSYRKVLFEKLTVFQLLKISRILRNPIFPLSYSKQPTTCLYLEPDESSPLPSIPLRNHFHIMLPFTPKHSKCSSTFTQSSQQKRKPVFVSIIYHKCHIPRSLFFPRFVNTRSTNHELPMKQFSPAFCFASYLLGRNNFLQQPVLEPLDPVFLHYSSKPGFTNRKHIIIIIIIMYKKG